MTSTPTAERVRQERNDRIAWSNMFVKNSGNWVLQVALPIYIEAESGLAISFLFVSQLLAGALLDPIGD